MKLRKQGKTECAYALTDRVWVCVCGCLSLSGFTRIGSSFFLLSLVFLCLSIKLFRCPHTLSLSYCWFGPFIPKKNTKFKIANHEPRVQSKSSYSQLEWPPPPWVTIALIRIVNNNSNHNAINDKEQHLQPKHHHHHHHQIPIKNYGLVLPLYWLLLPHQHHLDLEQHEQPWQPIITIIITLQHRHHHHPLMIMQLRRAISKMGIAPRTEIVIRQSR